MRPALSCSSSLTNSCPCFSTDHATKTGVLHRCIHLGGHASAGTVTTAIGIVAQERPALDDALLCIWFYRIITLLRTLRIDGRRRIERRRVPVGGPLPY